jgi:hypothetical protein
MRQSEIPLTEIVPLPIDLTLRKAVKGLNGESSCLCADRALAFGQIMCPHGHGLCDRADDAADDTVQLTRSHDEPDPHSLDFADIDDPMPNGMTREEGLFLVLQRRPGLLYEIYEEAQAHLGDDRTMKYGMQVLKALPCVVTMLASEKLFRTFCRKNETTAKLRRDSKTCATARQMYLALAR